MADKISRDDGIARYDQDRSVARSFEGAYREADEAREAERKRAAAEVDRQGIGEAQANLERLERAGMADSWEASMWRMRAGYERIDREREAMNKE